MTNHGIVVVAVGLAVVALVGVQIVGLATSQETQDHIDDSAEWCEQRGGELHNVQVLGPHGGLHCELPNGTSVHMNEVLGDGDG